MAWYCKIVLYLTILGSSSTVLAKMPIISLGGINWFSEGTPEELLNPLHGVVFSESGLLRNLGEIEHDDDIPPVKAAHALIRNLFHALPSGYVLSGVPDKIGHYLHAELIGKLIGEYFINEKKGVNLDN